MALQKMPKRVQGFEDTPSKGKSRVVKLDAISEPDEHIGPMARATPDALEGLVRRGYSEEEVSALVVPRRTLARRRAAGDLLTVEETDKALRLERVATLAERVFGDPAKAHRWLRKPKDRLHGDTPITFLASESGARVVEEMLHQIQHGIFA